MKEYSLSAVFLHYLESEKPNGIQKRIAEFIAFENLSRDAFDNLLKEEGIKDVQLKEILLDQVLLYAQKCVKDHELTDDEQKNLLLLNILFRIKEGDFLNFRKRVVQHILSTQISKILHDRLITKPEEILLADLQRIFGLNVSQYTNLIQPSIETHIKELEVWGSHCQSLEEKERIQTCIRVLSSI